VPWLTRNDLSGRIEEEKVAFKLLEYQVLPVDKALGEGLNKERTDSMMINCLCRICVGRKTSG
jgi:hypothetical protein